MLNVDELQLELIPLASPEPPAIDTIEARFIAFHRANPHVFRSLYAIARAMKADGWQRAGIKALFERLRWLHAVQTRGEKYKLCNSFTAFYARAIMAYDQTLAGFFELRSMRGRDEYAPGVEELSALGLRPVDREERDADGFDVVVDYSPRVISRVSSIQG